MTSRFGIFSTLVSAFVLAAVPTFAVDGVILIDQNRALAGNVTPGDAPGFPVTISASGSYRLSSNLVVPDVNTTAILVSTSVDAVTIDLNGFSIIGPVSCSINPTTCSSMATDVSIFGPGTGIRSDANAALTVKNGTIIGMGRYAIFQSGGAYTIIENLHARENGRGGIWPSIGMVINSVVSTNGGDGITMNLGLIRGTISTRNAEDGIASTGQALNVQESQVTHNGGFGINFNNSGAVGANLIQGNLGGAIDGPATATSGNVCSGSGCP